MRKSYELNFLYSFMWLLWVKNRKLNSLTVDFFCFWCHKARLCCQKISRDETYGTPQLRSEFRKNMSRQALFIESIPRLWSERKSWVIFKPEDNANIKDRKHFERKLKMQIFIGRQTIVTCSFLSRKKWALWLYTSVLNFRSCVTHIFFQDMNR